MLDFIFTNPIDKNLQRCQS